MAAATKHALLGLVDQAVAEGFTTQAACRVLQVAQRRVNRWQARRAAGTLADRPAGGGAVHGLLDEEVEQILDLAEEWGEVDRSHRKLAHRGSRLGRVCLTGQRLQGAGRPRPGAAQAGGPGAGPAHALAGLDHLSAQPGVGLGRGAPRGAIGPCGGERTPPPVRRSGLVKLGAARAQGRG